LSQLVNLNPQCPPTYIPSIVPIKMAESQPPNVVEGATTGDIDEEVPVAAKSAEDRKAAAALSSLDAPRDDGSASRDVDQEAVKKAMDRLAGQNGVAKKKAEEEKKVVKKTVKVDPADVSLLVCSSITNYWRFCPMRAVSSPYNCCQIAIKHDLTPHSQVEELELSKIKATDLLKAHDGEVGKALKAYITPV
jgi:hypothetical protein